MNFIPIFRFTSPIFTYREEFRPSSILSGFRTGFDGLVMLLRHANLSPFEVNETSPPKREKKEKEKERNRRNRFLLLIKSAIIRSNFTFARSRSANSRDWSLGYRRAEEARVDNEVDPTQSLLSCRQISYRPA